MITTIALCAKILLINHTNNFNEIDKRSLETAKVRCEKIYPALPCVKKFVKIKERSYRVICGTK